MSGKAKKITVVGAGVIGSTVAYTLMLKELSEEIVLVNRNRARGQAKASDIAHCVPLTGGMRVGSGGFEASFASDIVVVTLGVRPDEDGTRMDVLASNIGIYKDIIPQIVKFSPEAVIVIVTNPLDIMTYIAYKLSGFPPGRVIGSGTLLDSIRFRYILGSKLDINPSDIRAMVIGEHGETMVPLWSRVKVSGTGMQEYLAGKGIRLDEDMIRTVTMETRRAGWDIRLGKEHSCYGISLSAVRIIENLLGFVREELPVSALACGEYGIDGVFLSLPSILGEKGIRQKVEYELSGDEKSGLLQSAEALAGCIAEADALL